MGDEDRHCDILRPVERKANGNEDWHCDGKDARRARIRRLSDLPPDELLPEELELREALFDFLSGYESRNPGSLPSISQTRSDWAVRRCYARLFGHNVELSHWI